MALTKCPECGNTISDKAISCPHCGYVVKQVNNLNTPKKSGNKGILILLVVVAIIASVTWGAIKHSENKNKEYKELIYQKSGGALSLKGDYTNAELRGIAEGGKLYIEKHNDLQNKIFQQEGLAIADIREF